MSERIQEILKTVFPMTTQEERHRFELLRRRLHRRPVQKGIGDQQRWSI